MTDPEPAHPPRLTPEALFRERHGRWEMLHRLEGPGRSYPYAWRLPELARPLGQAVLEQAQHALALDLYTLGRFAEARAALPITDRLEEAARLRHRLDLLLDIAAADAPRDGDTPLVEACLLAYLGDRPLVEDAGGVGHGGGIKETHRHWLTVFRAWSLARAGRPGPLADAHGAVRKLRERHPTQAVQAEALLAEAIYLADPRWSPVWLDHALDQVERYSQHHLKVRLMALKARALEAAGELGEGGRFRKQAAALAERQGARLYRRLFIDEANRP